MRKIKAWIIFASRTWWLFGIIFALNMVSLRVLFALEDRFQVATGLPVFDTQNDLTSITLLQQLPLYQGTARTAYLHFAAFDFVFPFVAASFLAVLWAWLLRSTTWPIADRLLRWNIPLLAFLVTLFDYLENVSLLTIIYAGFTWEGAVNAAILFKRLKLTGLTLSSTLTGLLMTLAIANWLYRVWQARFQHAKATQ
jgi:hypothetical protein